VTKLISQRSRSICDCSCHWKWVCSRSSLLISSLAEDLAFNSSSLYSGLNSNDFMGRVEVLWLELPPSSFESRAIGNPLIHWFEGWTLFSSVTPPLAEVTSEFFKGSDHSLHRSFMVCYLSLGFFQVLYDLFIDQYHGFICDILRRRISTNSFLKVVINFMVLHLIFNKNRYDPMRINSSKVQRRSSGEVS